MQADRRSCRRTMIVIGAAALLVVAPLRPQSPRVLYNRTASMPTGFYVYQYRTPIHRGDIVALSLPRAAYPYARLRGERTDVLLLKHVLAIGGDFVCTLDGALRINGVVVGPIASVDSAGRPLPRWLACRSLSGDELLVGSTEPHSFDGRYFGPVHASQVFGVYRPLVFGFSSSPQNPSESLPCSPTHRVLPIARCASGGQSTDE